MNCVEYRQLISAKLDGELSAAEEAALAAHLVGCVACRDFSASLAKLKDEMLLWPGEVMPREVERAILGQIAAQHTRPRRPVAAVAGGYYRLPRGLVWASAVVFLLLLLNTIFGPFAGRRGAVQEQPTANSEYAVQKITLTKQDIRSLTVYTKRNGT